MLANVKHTLRDLLNQATYNSEPQDEYLLAAGAVIAQYVEGTVFTRANGERIAPLSLTPDVLKNSDEYPRLKFIVDKERLGDAIDILHKIDMKAPSMQGVTFNQLISCNEETCMIVLRAGAPLMCEFAGELLKKMPQTAAPEAAADIPALKAALR